MAIYSLHHSSIGKSTQAQPYTAAAHVSYITRKSALSFLEAGGMPASKKGAMAFLTRLEDYSRANARVADKLLLALPRELSPEQRRELVRAFGEAVSKGRAPWIAAIHENGKDAQNPHCHFLLVDRDKDTGKRVFQTSEMGSTERLRRLWEDYTNHALAQAKRPERVDRRTLEAQGLSRRPTIHIGVRARELMRKNYRATSRERIVANRCQSRTATRRVDYPVIDRGKLRLEHNIDIRRANMFASRAARQEKEYWGTIDKAALLRDIEELKRLHAVLERGDDGSLFRARDERLDRGQPGLER